MILLLLVVNESMQYASIRVNFRKGHCVTKIQLGCKTFHQLEGSPNHEFTKWILLGDLLKKHVATM